MLRTESALASHLRFSALWLACALIVLAATTAEAQSGRRKQNRGNTTTTSSDPLPKSTPQPPADASPPPEQQQKPTPELPQTSILLVSDIAQTSYSIFTFPGTMRTWIAKRLRDSGAFTVMEGQPSSRSEAIKTAKSSKESFVVWVQLDESGFRPSPGRTAADEVRISYFIYIPETGKTKSSGVVYLNSGRPTIDLGVGRVGIPCYPGVRGREYLLLQASLEVANRILSVFNAPRPPICT